MYSLCILWCKYVFTLYLCGAKVVQFAICEKTLEAFYLGHGALGNRNVIAGGELCGEQAGPV